MSSLEHYQRQLLTFLYAARPGSPPPSWTLAARQRPDRVALGLTIYRRNLIFAVCRAMAEIYPLCRDLLREGNFNFLFKQYIHLHPSTVRDLGDYGERFADSLTERPEVRDHPFLADVARLEWLCHRAARLPREAWLDEQELRAGPDLHRIARSALSARASYTILELWNDHQRGGIDAIRPETIRSRVQHLLVWSDAGRPRVIEIEPSLAARLRELASIGPKQSADVADYADATVSRRRAARVR